MDAPEMETLAFNASLTQREALLKHLDHHLSLVPLIGVSIPVSLEHDFRLTSLTRV
jgi:hypothetical protein